MRKKISVITVTILLFLGVVLSGCMDTPPEGETDWVGLLDSYNPKTDEFEVETSEKGGKTIVVVEDVVKSVGSYGAGKTSITFESDNGETSAYLTFENSYDHDAEDYGSPLYTVYELDDDIHFWVEIREDDYGEYIVELEP